MGVVVTFKGRGPLADLGLAGDQGWAILAHGPAQGAGDLTVVMAVDALSGPACGLEPQELIHAIRQGDGAVDGDVVVVP